MGYQLVGKIIAINQIETIASKTDASKTFDRRQVYLDCSRYDSITGEKLQDNKPLLEFGGKGLEQLNDLVDNGLKKGDLVSVEFAVQGTSYKDAHGNTKNFTGIRPYAIERYVRRSENVQSQAPQVQPQAQPQVQVQPQPQVQAPFPSQSNDDLPF